MSIEFPKLKTLTYANFLNDAIRSGNSILPGDLIIVKSGERSILNPLIHAGQIAALWDLKSNFSLTFRDIWKAGAYSHVKISNGEDGTYDHYYPKTRKQSWESMIGREFMVVRPKRSFIPYDYKYLKPALKHCVKYAAEDYHNGAKYSIRELFYYSKWGVKFIASKIPLIPNLKFDFFFKHILLDSEGNVCSGQAWDWYRRAGWFSYLEKSAYDSNPYAWYPARFLIDQRWEVVDHYKITKLI